MPPGKGLQTMLKEICMERFQMLLSHAEREKNPLKRNVMIPWIQGFLDGLFWSNVVDSDEFMELNEKITSLYLK